MSDANDRVVDTEEGELTALKRRVEELEGELARARDSTRPEALARRRLRDAMDVAGIGIFDWDAATGSLYWSDAHHRIYDVSANGFDRTFEGVLERVHGDDRARIESTVRAALADIKPFELNHRIVRDGGEVRHVRVMGCPFADDDGRLAQMTGVVMDITEHQRSERELERMVRQLAEAQVIARMGSFEWSRDGREMQVSKEIYRIFDYEPSKDSASNAKRYFDYIHPDDLEEVERELAQARESEDGSFRFEHRIVRDDGEVHHVLVEGRFDREGDGGATRVIGTLKDVTQERQRAQADRTFEQRLLRSQKLEALGQLAGGVAHDFNNLLTAIMGNVAIMRRRATRADGQYATESVDAGLREIEQASRRATDLTRQLLAFGRRPIGRPDPVDLNQTITSMGEMLARLIGEHIHLDVDLDGGEQGMVVRADPTQLEQVILNLVINARDAMPEGGLLTLSTFRVEVDEAAAEGEPGAAGGAHIVIRVQDTGVGIPPEVVDRIFEPFFTTKPAGRGTGLGLATVYGAMRQARGHCAVQSAPGKGTIFDVRFPAALEEAAPSNEGQRVEPARGGEETILLCEDDDQVRQVTSEILRSRGYEVLEAADGHAALRIVDAGRVSVDLLLTDVVMPHVDGRTLARQFLEKEPNLPVVFVSGYTPDAPVDSSSSFPGPLVQKPFNAEELLLAVRRALDSAEER